MKSSTSASRCGGSYLIFSIKTCSVVAIVVSLGLLGIKGAWFAIKNEHKLLVSDHVRAPNHRRPTMGHSLQRIAWVQ